MIIQDSKVEIMSINMLDFESKNAVLLQCYLKIWGEDFFQASLEKAC
jgi:hypothetical protein